MRASSEEMIGLSGKRNRKVSFGNPICFCVLKSGVPLLCDSRGPGVDCVGEPRPEMPPAVLEQHQGQQSSPWKVVSSKHIEGSKAELRV